MLAHYLKLSFKNFRHNKVIFFASILTLSLGTLCISLLFSYVYNQFHRNSFLSNKDDIYMTAEQFSKDGVWNLYHFGELSDFNTFPEIKTSTSVRRLIDNEVRFTVHNNIFNPSGLVVDTTFFQVFDFNIVKGDKKHVFQLPNSIVITESLAKKLFGNENPIGKNIEVSFGQKVIQTVSAVVEDVPKNSTLKFDYLINYQTKKNGFVYETIIPTCFFVINKQVNKDQLIKKINESIKPKNFYNLTLLSLDEVFFQSSKKIGNDRVFDEFESKQNLYILEVIMTIIFLVTVFNYINIQVINVTKRNKNLMLRKINGESALQMIFQQLIEMLCIILITAAISLLIYNLLLPYFNTLTNISVVISQAKVIIFIFLVITAIVIIAFLKTFIKVFKVSANYKNIIGGESKLFARGKSIVFQYTVSIILLILSMIVYKQLRFLLQKDLGYHTDNIIVTQLLTPQVFWRNNESSNGDLIKKFINHRNYVNNELKNISAISSFAQGNSPLEFFSLDFSKSEDKNDKKNTANIINVTPNYDKLLGLTLKEGRFFESDKDNSYDHKIVINESAKRIFNIKDIHKEFLNFNVAIKKMKIIGVVKDFDYEYLGKKSAPLFLSYDDSPDINYLIKFKEGNVQQGLKKVAALYHEINPKETFEYTFLKDDVAHLYDKEKRLSTIYILFTFTSLLISSIGLFTIALYDTQHRKKEIGIRKVNGAGTKEILLLLNQDFLKYIAIAFVIAVPVSWYAMLIWLQDFAYKTSISWWLFVLAGAIVLVIAMCTVSWQSYVASKTKPVNVLKDE
ncbi:ABC transporter permease [Zhouia sp. PK063]|uniref:ABC transporter permease n=1 Tax=Zhouia sp. PK063 TaxID=3373602 RepID=UPI0037BA911F